MACARGIFMTGRITARFAPHLACLILFAAAGVSVAADTAAEPRAAKALMALTADQIDPARLLPAPPADGSERQKAELADVQRIYHSRTPERLAKAQWD